MSHRDEIIVIRSLAESDLGIFSMVVGATGLILIVLAHQSVRHPWN